MAGSLKEHTLAFMQRVGVTSRVAASGGRRRRLLILCYHGIARFDEHVWNPELLRLRCGRVPILKSYALPSTVYLATLRSEHNMPIVGLMLSYLLWQHRARPASARPHLEGPPEGGHYLPGVRSDHGERG